MKPQSLVLALCVPMTTLAIAQDALVPMDDSPIVVESQVSAMSRAAISALANRTGRAAAEYSILAEGRVDFPLSGASAETFKIEHQATGEIHQVAIDSVGREVSFEALAEIERGLHSARYGRLDPRLFELLEGAVEGAKLPVEIWFVTPEYVGPERMLPEVAEYLLEDVANAEEYTRMLDDARKAFVEDTRAPFAAQMRGRGLEFEADELVPVAYARLTPAEIRQVEGWSTVQRIYATEQATGQLANARRTIYADTVNNFGITGSGVRAAQLEVGGRVGTWNPYLTGVIQDFTFVCWAASLHSTGVAGVIRSTHPTTRGIAPAATLWAGGSCGGWTNELQDRSTAAANWGATTMNLSFGANIGLTPGSMDRYYDSLVMNNARTIVVAAGNNGAPWGNGTGRVTSPALAYNVVTVGDFNDNNSFAWAGDTMSGWSSFVDPTSSHNDREKPEIAAPGANITMTSLGGDWVNYTDSGTSFAAPMVTGTTALMMQRNGALKSWPESVKAILMATAVHNIEGASRLSEKDGAGGLVTYYADRVVTRVGGNWGGVSYDCNRPTDWDVTTLDLIAGRKTRVVIAWDNDPNYADYASQPCADLDLRIVNSAGSTVASSSSWDNNYEIVEFTPTVTGTYRLRIHKYRCSASPRYLGWAWYRQ